MGIEKFMSVSEKKNQQGAVKINLARGNSQQTKKDGSSLCH